MAKHGNPYVQAPEAAVKLFVTGLLWLRTDGHDEVYAPPTTEGRHAKLVRRDTQISTTWYLDVRSGGEYVGRHRASDILLGLVCASDAELVLLPRGRWYRTGGGWPTGTDRWLT